MDNKFKILLLFCMWITSVSAQADTKIIVNSGNNYEISERELVALYLGKTTTLKNGKQVIPLHQPEDSDAYAYFTEHVIKKSKKQYKAYWAKKIFTGKGRPPKTVSSNDAMIAKVASDELYIGYVKDNDSTHGVRILIF